MLTVARDGADEIEAEFEKPDLKDRKEETKTSQEASLRSTRLKTTEEQKSRQHAATHKHQKMTQQPKTVGVKIQRKAETKG